MANKRRNYNSAFKAKGALAAIHAEGTLAEMPEGIAGPMRDHAIQEKEHEAKLH